VSQRVGEICLHFLCLALLAAICCCLQSQTKNFSMQELKVPLPLKVATGRGRLPLKLQVKSDKRFIGQIATALEEYKQEWKDC